MHFYCKCGYRITDSTDNISYKAHIIADQDWYDFLDRITAAIKSDETNREKVIDEFYSDTTDIDKLIYQCPKCGQIFIDGEGRRLYSFCAEGETKTDLLLSVKGKNWQGYLQAEWEDVKPEWSEHHGYIWPIVNLDYDIPGFDDYNKFIEKYYQLFEELKSKNILRYSYMKRNMQILHFWDATKTEKKSTLYD